MKKAFTILLLLVYLLSTTELHQLLKMPLLVQHFIEHREENRSITLYEFLYTHYVNDDGKASDYDQNRKLPFKSHDNCISVISSNVCLPLSGKTFIQNPELSAEKKKLPEQESFLLKSYFSNIWQPPRIS